MSEGFLRGQSGFVLTGDAAVSDVKSGKTFYNNNGNTKLTGTLESDGKKYLYRLGTKDVAWVNYNLVGTSTFTDEVLDGYISINAQIAEGMSVTDAAIDLTAYSKLYVAWQGSLGGGMSNNFSIIASTVKEDRYTSYNARISRSAAFVNVESLDISALTGNHYVRYHAYSHYDGETNYVNLRVYAVWLEV